MKFSGKLYLFFYFLILTIVALKFIPSLPMAGADSNIHFNSTLKEIIDKFGGMDPASFAKGGWSVYSKGKFHKELIHLLDLWPPGFMVLEGLILKIFGENAPIVGILQVLAAFTLAITFNLFRSCLNVYVRPFFAALIPLLLLLSSQFRSFMLGPETVLLGETFAINFVLIGLFCLLLAYAASTKNKKYFAILAGMSFALSAYFRSQFEIFFMIASLNFLIILLMIVIYQITRGVFQAGRSRLDSSSYRIPLYLIFLSLITFHMLTVPYKIYTHKRTHSYLWVQTSQLMFRNNFIPSTELAKIGPSFLQGGANMACVVDPITCEKIVKQIHDGTLPNKKLKKYAISIFLHHPLLWIFLKIKLFPPFWFANLTVYYDLAATGFAALSITTSFFNYVFIACLIFSLAWICLTIRNPYSIINYWLSSSICMAYAIIFVFAHYEVRYFFFLKFYFFALAIFCFIQMLTHMKKSNRA